jgi:hypothetical protein
MLVERGVAIAAAEATLIRAIASGIMVRPDRNPAQRFRGALRFRVHADIRQSAGTNWRAAPNLDFTASTIEVPSRGDIGRAQFETKLRWAVIEIWADDIDCLWSSAAARKSQSGPGAKARGIAEAIYQLWRNRIPEGLSAKDRNKAIIEWLRANGRSRPTNPERAIQRVLKEQQFK